MLRKIKSTTSSSSCSLKKKTGTTTATAGHRLIHISDWNPEWEEFVPSDIERKKVQIPTRSWRVNNLVTTEAGKNTSSTSSSPAPTLLDNDDGSESTDDEAYLRRHKKFELVERRLVRWEMNRRRYEKLREKYVQKEQESLLRQRSYKKKSKPKKITDKYKSVKKTEERVT